MNLYLILAKGGPLMLVLAGLSVVAISIIIERYLTLAALSKNERLFWQSITTAMDEDRFEDIKKSTSDFNAPSCELIKKGLAALPYGHDNMSEAMDTAAKQEISILEKNLSTLSTIAAVAPLIGFLGTVTGMIKVFMKLQSAGSQVDISLLAGGIWEALITTVGGLAVGIIAIVFYNALVEKVQKFALDIETEISSFILQIKDLQK